MVLCTVLQDFPKGTSKELRDAVVSNRKLLIRDVMDALAGKAPSDFLSSRCADDIEFEDFFMRWQGRKEFSQLLTAASKMVKNLEYDVHGEHHGPHEVVMDWTLTTTPSFLPSMPIPLRMRTHILLEPPTQVGGQERVFRIYEEWNGNKQLNEKSTFGPLGKVHQRLRRFNGYLASSIMDWGIFS